ncbi:MAG: HAMP domain-containing protein [Hydrogenothermaceae bacterium]|nr:HAMP domain-containing protein [Hydrogenothermaceae bacterium]
MAEKKGSVLNKISFIVLGGSFLGVTFVGIMVFVLFSSDPNIIKKTLISVIISQILSLGLVFGIRALVDKFVVSKLREVSKAMNEVSMGNLDYEIKVEKTGDELEELADSFERMRISMKTIMEKLEKGEL